jgi:hypothetical protein
MGRALIAVGTFLAVCFAVFGGVVYFTRDEDAIAVDSGLSEALSKAMVDAETQGGVVDLRNVADFDFDRVLIFPPDTPRDAVSQALGFEFRGELRYTAESSEFLVFTNRGRFVRFADYRGRGRFEGLDRPFQYVDANDAVFEVDDGVVRLAGSHR